MLYTLIVDASGKLNNVCYDRQWITIELWEDIELVYRALVWIFINGFEIQVLVCFMKAPKSYVSITQGNTSMESPDELKAHQRVERERPLDVVARKARERIWDSLPKCR
jgi:hypothetical protein